MKMLNEVVPAVFLLSLTSPAVVADTEFEGTVPVEVALQFIGTGQGGQGKLYSDILAAFPPFTVPPDFTVLASADQGYAQRVILRTSLDAAAALDAVSAALTANDWQVIPDPGMARNQVGFISSAPQPMYRQLCNDAHGTLSLSVSEVDAVHYVSLSHNLSALRAGGQPTCAQLVDPASQGPLAMMRGSGLNQYVPRLVLPETPSTPGMPRAFMGGGGGGSSNDWETSGSLNIDWDIDDIAEHFIEQIEDQGWQRDAEVSGEVVATSSWTKTVDDMDLIGILTVLRRAENSWDLKFRLVRADTAANGVGIVNTVIRN